MGCVEKRAAAMLGRHSERGRRGQACAAGDQAVSDLEAASDAKDATDTRLGNALGSVGGLLTPPESAAFAKAFNALPDVVHVHDDYQTKSQTLADALGQVAADPAQIESYGAKNLLAGYALLAKTPAGKPAALAVRHRQVLAHRIVLPGVARRRTVLMDQVLGPSLAGAYLQNLLETGTVPDATSATVAVLAKGTSVTLNIAGWLQRYNAFQQVDVIDNAIGVSSQSTGRRPPHDRGHHRDLDYRRRSLPRRRHKRPSPRSSNSGGNAVNGIAAATSALPAAFAWRHRQRRRSPTRVIKWAGKIATGVGLVMNAINLWNDAGHWNDSAAAKVQVAADVIALSASIAVLVSTGPVGPILATVSLGLGFFVAWLDERTAAEQEIADVKSCLPPAGLDPALVQTIANADPAMHRRSSPRRSGLAPEPGPVGHRHVDPSLVDGRAREADQPRSSGSRSRRRSSPSTPTRRRASSTPWSATRRTTTRPCASTSTCAAPTSARAGPPTSPPDRRPRVAARRRDRRQHGRPPRRAPHPPRSRALTTSPASNL